MKPEKLILEGVYSYKNRAEIDFTTLCEAELFGIFGNVGSGKSAILEAITYVLYGRIERLSSKMMNYNMMNLSSNKMFIEFSFVQKQKKYRFRFEAKRNKKDFEKIESPRKSAYLLQDGEWLPLFDKDSEVTAEQILGLNYDNFRRTIIVPQGRFQEFLHLEKSKRTAMLMELFRLNRFDLYARAAALAGSNSEKIAVLEERIGNLSDATVEAVDLAAEEFEALGNRVAELSEDIKASDKRLNEMSELGRLGQALSEARERFNRKKDDASEFEKKKARLAVYEECRERIKPSLDRYDNIVEERGGKAEQLSLLGSAVREAAAGLETAEAEFKRLSDEYRMIDRMKAQKTWFAELSVIGKERAAAEGLKMRIAELESERGAMQQSLEKITSEYEKLNAEIGAADGGGRTVEEMTGLLYSFRSLVDRDTDSAALNDLLKQMLERERILGDEIAGFGSPEDEERRLEEKKALLRNKLLDREIMKGIGELAGRLEPGRPCPVCGATEHPAPADFSLSADNQLADEEAGIAEAEQQLGKNREGLSALNHERELLQVRIKETEEKICKNASERESLAGSISSGGYTPADYEVFSAEYAEFVQKADRREELLKRQPGLGAEKEGLNSELAAKIETLGRLRVELGRSETVIAETEGRVDADFLKSNEGLSAEELAARSEQLGDKITGLDRSFDEAGKARADASVAYERLLSEEGLLQKQLAVLEDKKTTTEIELKEAVKNSGFDSTESAREVLAGIPDALGERREIELFEKEFTDARKELSVLTEQIAARNYDRETHELEQDKNAELKEAYRQAVNRQGELGNILKDLRQRLERKTASIKELDLLKIRGTNLGTLKNLFREKGFANYAATVYLRELCEVANTRFRKLTREALRLELDENNNFIIRDYLNEGKTRSVKTLSGGQTFQAAFSLSLALADSIGRERSGFFFLDEGFGSLDRESLALVFDSLKSLKKEKRTVGIISHVEDLKQEIDTYISVIKDNESGSTIKNSWHV